MVYYLIGVVSGVAALASRFHVLLRKNADNLIDLKGASQRIPDRPQQGVSHLPDLLLRHVFSNS